MRPVAPKIRNAHAPGARLQKAIEELYDQNKILNRQDFADQVSVPEYVLHRILMGTLPLTTHLAGVIESRFSISARKLLAPPPKPRAKYKRRVKAKKPAPVKKALPLVVPKISKDCSIYAFVPDESLDVPPPSQRIKWIINYLIQERKLRFKKDFASLMHLPPKEMLRLQNAERMLSPELAAEVENVFGIQQEWVLFGMKRRDTTATIPASLKKHIEDVRNPEDYLAPRPAKLIKDGSIPPECARLQELMFDLHTAGLVKSRRHFARVIDEDYLVLNSILVGKAPITYKRAAAMQRVGISPAWVVFGVGKKYMKAVA